MRLIRLTYYNEKTGKTTYYLNVNKIHKIEFTRCFNDEEYVHIKLDDLNIEGVCKDFDEICFELFLTDPESCLQTTYGIDIYNYELLLLHRKDPQSRNE